MLRGSNAIRLAGLAVTAALAVAGCSSSGSSPSGSQAAGQSSASSPDAAAMSNPNLDLGTSLGGKSAPDIKLVNQFGQPMSLSQFRGRVVMLTFHSGEDRRVKKAFQAGHRVGVYAEVAEDVIRPSKEETRANRRASSAKLRWAVRAVGGYLKEISGK